MLNTTAIGSIRELCSKGKFFDIETSDKKKGLEEIKKISVELLSNPIIEDFKILKK